MDVNIKNTKNEIILEEKERIILTRFESIPNDSDENEKRCSLSVYTIYFRSNKAFFLGQFPSENEARKKFDCLAKILSTLKMSREMRKRKITDSKRFIESLFETMLEHPNWSDVHLAAYVSYALIDLFEFD